MTPAYAAYRLFSTGVFWGLLPLAYAYFRLTGRYRNSLTQRLGVYPKALRDRICGSPRIWIHAVSVGEVRAALPIIDRLCQIWPGCALILSTTTEQGQALARDRLKSMATCIYAPLDFVSAVRKALKSLKPDILVFIETEIWPNWLAEARRLGVKTAIINGRISQRSFNSYRRIRPLIREALSHVGAFSMIGRADAARIMFLGVPQAKIEINGNAKFDLLLQQTDARVKNEMMRLYDICGDHRVFVAGSTRNPEEQIILKVYQKIFEFFPDTLLVIAPRHIRRAKSIENMVKSRGITCQRRTELDPEGCPRRAPVVILDTIGELQATYSIASVAFCGGSLAPRGGQNILEAAAWGKPVFYGPSMENFLDAKALLDATGGGIQVVDERELAEKIIYYLSHPHQAARVGALAREAVSANRAAARKHAAVICRLLQKG